MIFITKDSNGIIIIINNHLFTRENLKEIRPNGTTGIEIEIGQSIFDGNYTDFNVQGIVPTSLAALQTALSSVFPKLNSTGSGSLIPFSFIAVEDYGAIGDGVTDDADAIQTAINYAIANKIATVFFKPKTYICTKPLIIANFSGGIYQQVTLNLYGEASFWASQGSGSQLVFTSKNTFGIGIQIGKGCKIKGLITTGAYTPPTMTDAAFYSMDNVESTYNDATCRNTRFSPYTGIVIDPFTLNVPADGGYPTLTAYYKGSSGNSGSTGTEFQDLFIRNFTVGIITSPNGITQNAEIMIGNKIQFANCKWCIAGTQSQEKANNWTNIHSWGDCYGIYTNMSYGLSESGNADFSIINLAGRNRVFCNAITSGRFPCSFSDIYGERLGEIGLSNSNFFTRVFVDFENYTTAGFNRAYIKSSGANGSTYRDCRFRFYGLIGAIPIEGSNYFDNVEFSGDPITSNYWQDPRDYNTFRNCVVKEYGTGRITKLGLNAGHNMTGINEEKFSFSMYGNDNVKTPDVHLLSGGTPLTVNSPRSGQINGYGSYPDFKVGDMLNFIFNSKSNFAMITSIAAGNLIVQYFPSSFITAGYGMYRVLPYLNFGHFIGDFTVGSNSITNVKRDDKTGISLATLNGKVFYNPYSGIIDRINVVASTTLTISSNSSVTKANAIVNNSIAQKFYYNTIADWTTEDANMVLGVGDEIYIGHNSDVETKYRVIRSGLKSNTPIATLAII